MKAIFYLVNFFQSLKVEVYWKDRGYVKLVSCKILIQSSSVLTFLLGPQQVQKLCQEHWMQDVWNTIDRQHDHTQIYTLIYTTLNVFEGWRKPIHAQTRHAQKLCISVTEAQNQTRDPGAVRRHPYLLHHCATQF